MISRSSPCKRRVLVINRITCQAQSKCSELYVNSDVSIVVGQGHEPGTGNIRVVTLLPAPVLFTVPVGKPVGIPIPVQFTMAAGPAEIVLDMPVLIADIDEMGRGM